MGFDPMTHQPRTDLVSTLPFLLALANMTDLIDHPPQPLDEQSIKLQAEAVQLARLEYLHYLLQSTTNSFTSTNSYDQNANNMEALHLLTSMSHNVNDNTNALINFPQLDSSSLFSNEIPSSQPLHQHPNMLLSQVSSDPQPQVSFNTSQLCLTSDENNEDTNNFTMIREGDNMANDTSLWMIPSIDLSGTTGTSSNTNPGDASSRTSSHEGATSSSYWPELFFDDPILNNA